MTLTITSFQHNSLKETLMKTILLKYKQICFHPMQELFIVLALFYQFMNKIKFPMVGKNVIISKGKIQNIKFLKSKKFKDKRNLIMHLLRKYINNNRKQQRNLRKCKKKFKKRIYKNNLPLKLKRKIQLLNIMLMKGNLKPFSKLSKNNLNTLLTQKKLFKVVQLMLEILLYKKQHKQETLLLMKLQMQAKLLEKEQLQLQMLLNKEEKQQVVMQQKEQKLLSTELFKLVKLLEMLQLMVLKQQVIVFLQEQRPLLMKQSQLAQLLQIKLSKVSILLEISLQMCFIFDLHLSSKILIKILSQNIFIIFIILFLIKPNAWGTIGCQPSQQQQFWQELYESSQIHNIHATSINYFCTYQMLANLSNNFAYIQSQINDLEMQILKSSRSTSNKINSMIDHVIYHCLLSLVFLILQALAISQLKAKSQDLLDENCRCSVIIENLITYYKIQKYQMGAIFARVPPPDDTSNCYVWTLRVITLIQLLIVISNFICLNQYLVEALFGLLLILFLIIAFHKLSYQALLMYIFFSIFFTIMFLVDIFTPVQQQQDIKGYNLGNMYCFIDAIVSCFFYICVSIFCFFPYKAFKIHAFNSNPALANYYDWQQQQKNQADNPNSANQQKNTDRIQQKRNTEEQLNRVDYLRQQPHQPHQEQSKGGPFSAFKGKGVRIG